MNLFDLYASLTLDKSGFERGIAQAKSSIDGLTRSFPSVGQGLQNMGKSISNFGQGIANVGKAASVVTAGVGVTLGAAFNKSKEFIGTYESAMTVFTRKLDGGKEAAGRLYDGLVTIAKGSSFAQEHMISAGQTLVAMGLDADTTQRYVQAATDAIAGMGGSGEEVEEMATLFAKVSQQTNLYTEDIQQMVERGIPAWDILATKYHTTTDEVKEMARKGLLPAKESLDTITGALEESDEASEMFKYSMHGLAAELKNGTLTGTMDSLNTSFRTFSLRLLDLDPRTESGQENIKRLNAAISKFGELLEKVGSKFGKIIGKDIARGLELVTDFLEKFNSALDNMPDEQAEMIVHAIEAIAIAGPALIIVGNAIKFIGGAVSGLGTLFSGISSAISGVSSAFGVLTGAAGGTAGALGIIAAAIVALIALFVVVKENWDKIVQAFTEWYEKSGIKEKLESLRTKFEELGAKLGTLHDYLTVLGTYIGVTLMPIIIALQGVFSGLITFFEGVITVVGGIIDIFAGLGEVIVGIFTGDQEKVQKGLEQFFNGILGVFSGAFTMIFGTVMSYIESIWAAVQGWLDSFGINISGWFGNLGNGITVWFTELGNNIGAWFTNIFNNLGKWLADMATAGMAWFEMMKNAFSEWCKNVIDAITAWCNFVWSTITDKWNGIKDTIWNVINQIYNNIRSVFDNAKNAVTDIMNNVKSNVENIWNNITNSISNAVNNIWNNVTNTFNNVVNSIRDAMGRASDAVWGIIENIKGFFNFEIHWPNIPLPHFRIDPSGWQIGDLLQGSVPSLGIDWYAKGGVFTKPTIFPTLNGLAGVGEAGAEAVLPVKVLKDYVKEAMAEGVKEAQISYKDSVSKKSNASMVNALLATLGEKEQEINVYIGGNQIANEIYEPLMNIMKKKEVRVGA